MSRYLSWLANGTLLVLSCFLVANTANAVIASWLAPSPDEVATIAAPATAANRSWAQRQMILDRNLFKATLATSKPPPPPVQNQEDLEATTLPLALIGTVAASDPADSWAAVQDNDTRTHIILQQGDNVKGKATVQRIEPKRIVLRENGQLRELTLSDDLTAAPAAKPKRGRAANRRGRANNRRAANVRPPARVAPPAPTENPLAGAAELFSQANMVPKFENGEMVGVQIDAVQPGSALEAAGIQSGDVITELNGVRINSQEESQKALANFATSGEMKMKVRGSDGKSERDVEMPLTPTN